MGPAVRVLALGMAAAIAFGAFIEWFLTLILLDNDVCGYLAEAPCNQRFSWDALITIIGLGFSVGAGTAALACTLSGRRRFWIAAWVLLVPAALVGLVLFALDIPNRDPSYF